MKLLVTYKMKNGSTEAFLSELSGMGIPEIVRAESGCLRYDYFLPADVSWLRTADGSTDCVILVEEWESAELQALHLEQPHMKRLADIKPRYVIETAVEFIAEQRTSCGS